jgi:hypothetical protein
MEGDGGNLIWGPEQEETRYTFMNTVGDPGDIRTRYLLYRSHQRSYMADGAAMGFV